MWESMGRVGVLLFQRRVGTGLARLLFMTESLSTRIVSVPPIASRQTHATVFAPQATPNTDVFYVLPDGVVRGLNRPADAQRMLNELRYLQHFGSLLAETIGFETMELVVIEDVAAQSAFLRMPSGEDEATYYGIARKERKRLTQVRKELGKQD
jgi:hypothetical protein